jgi:ribonuclease HII
MPHVRAGRVIVGIDEVGRGSWAGPVTAAAVILPPRQYLSGLADSKLLSPVDRASLDRRIRRLAVAVGVGWASHDEVNEFGLSWAVKQSGRRALADLGAPFDVVILDGNHNYLREEQESYTFVKADQKIASVAAASIVAKVARDRYLERLDGCYPGYALASNKGYPAPAHLDGLRQLGPCAIHRTSWRPFERLAQEGFTDFGEFADLSDDEWAELDAK